MKIYFLSDKFPWFGQHQCYDRLPFFIKEINPEVEIVASKNSLPQRIAGKIYSVLQGFWWRRDSGRSAAESRFLNRCNKTYNKDSIYHILFFDIHHFLMKRWLKAPANIIGTIHHPSGREFSPYMLEHIKKLSSAVILHQRDIEFYEKYIGRNRVKFIHHGVDTEFFYPGEQVGYEEKHLFFTGQNGRNEGMLCRVIIKLTKSRPDLIFDLLVPKSSRYGNALAPLNDYSNVKWHEAIPETEVRRIYQKSYLLLMPMLDSGVNNAVVESLACGLPIVTTDTGGVRDYGGSSLYPVVPNNNDDAMIGLVEEYLGNQSWRNEIAVKCRKFAEKYLPWPLIAQKHLEAYKELTR